MSFAGVGLHPGSATLHIVAKSGAQVPSTHYCTLFVLPAVIDLSPPIATGQNEPFGHFTQNAAVLVPVVQPVP
jgi:hypothetical protein